MAALSATYRCAGCGEEADGIWPGTEQDGDGAPAAEQQCACGHRQLAEYPGFSFQTEAG
jgi:DNA-directed RNA polymerase subunit RPC12/RpoP